MTISNQKALRKLLDLICPVPDPTDGTDYSFNHDIYDFTANERKAALARVELRLLIDPDPSTWLLRRHRLLAEMEEGPE